MSVVLQIPMFYLEYTRIAEIINSYLKKVTVVQVSLQTVNMAWEIGEKYGYSYYDSLVIASALENDCSIFYSGDLQAGQVIENSLRIVNPFAGDSL